jgi:hypothetical protein
LLASQYKRGKEMAADRKHFEDIDDDFCFDEKLDGELSIDDDISEKHLHPLSWRRALIEKAVLNVKKAFNNKMDLQLSYEKGALVFDEQSNKFARVTESSPGFLSLVALDGEKLIRQDIDPLVFVQENRHKLTLPEISAKLSLSEVKVIELLNKLEFETLEKPEKVIKLPKKEVAKETKKSKAISVQKPLKISAKKKIVFTDSSVVFSKLLPKGVTTDPVVDPNGYIQQNFLLMSNKELSLATGLSEHTIRRKLGEWSLKRKNFLNKA